MLSRRAALALGVGALSACGFTPVYAPGGAGEGLRGLIQPDPPGTRTDFIFATQIEDRLGRSEGGALQLGYVLRFDDRSLGLTGTGATQRFAIEGVADYTVRDAGGTVLTSGRVDAFAGFSDIGTAVATRSARADATARVTVILADRVADRLLATAPGWRP